MFVCLLSLELKKMTKFRQKLQISHFDVIRALYYLTNKHGGEKSTGTQKTISQNLFIKIL